MPAGGNKGGGGGKGGFNAIRGTNNDDMLIGTDASDGASGKGGGNTGTEAADWIDGKGGDDILFGLSGNYWFSGQTAQDKE